MDQATFDRLRKSSFRTYYDTYFQELACKALVLKWQSIDLPVSWLVALTASGSAVVGWAIWSTSNGKIVWAIVAGVASVVSILHSVLGVPGKVKVQEDLRREFSKLRVDLETFMDNLSLDLDAVATDKQYKDLRVGRYSELMDRTHPDILFTKRLQNRVQDELDDKLKREERIQ